MKEHFQLEHQDNVGREALEIRPGAVVVTMRDSAAPFALKWALTHTNTDDQDLVVLAARMMGAGGPEYVDASEQLFSEHEQMLFTKAVSVAESFGKHISLLVVPAGDIFAALVQTANSLDAAAVVSGLSTKLTAAGAGLPCRPGMGGAAGAEAAVYFLCDQAGWRRRSASISVRMRRRLSRTRCNWSIGYGSICDVRRRCRICTIATSCPMRLTRMATEFASG